jgi:hypothetical protein
MAGLSSSGASSRPPIRSCSGQWRTRLIRARVRPIGVRRTDQRIGIDAFGEQINAVLSAGSDTHTPVAPVPGRIREILTTEQY